MEAYELYISRCFDLAKLALNNVKSNPNVGSLIVYENRILSEGFHQAFGDLHAERNAILKVKEQDKHLLPEATLFVSLEPCCIQGKTPACTDIILESGIKTVVISTLDPNPKMQGKSVELLRSKGINVVVGILQMEGRDLIKPFMANLQKRPYVILKFAQSSDGYIGKRGEQMWLSQQSSKFKVHQWRSQVDGIMIGYQTALIDNPMLTTRLVPGSSPLRVILDDNLSLPRTHHCWADAEPCLFVTQDNNSACHGLKEVVYIPKDENYLVNLLKLLYKKGICRLMIEGGAQTINAFLEAQLWDEARVIRTSLALGTGIRAPRILGRKTCSESFESDKIEYIYRT